MDSEPKNKIDVHVVIVVLMSVLLLGTAVYLFFERTADVRVERQDANNAQPSRGDTTLPESQPNDTDSNEENLDGDPDLLLETSGKYEKFGSCTDIDSETPYFVKTFIGNYKYTDGGFVSDFCAESFESMSLVEFMCIDGNIASESHRCAYGCLLGACMTELEERAYIQSSILFDSVEWEETGVAYEIFSGYVGNMLAPINTTGPYGESIDPGTPIHGLSLIVNLHNTNDTDVCAPLSVKRIVDETGASVSANTSEFYFGFGDAGCTLPAGAVTQYKIIFLTEPGETDFIITAGSENKETFIVTHDRVTGEVNVEQTVPLG